MSTRQRCITPCVGDTFAYIVNVFVCVPVFSRFFFFMYRHMITHTLSHVYTVPRAMGTVTYSARLTSHTHTYTFVRVRVRGVGKVLFKSHLSSCATLHSEKGKIFVLCLFSYLSRRTAEKTVFHLNYFLGIYLYSNSYEFISFDSLPKFDYRYLWPVNQYRWHRYAFIGFKGIKYTPKTNEIVYRQKMCIGNRQTRS